MVAPADRGVAAAALDGTVPRVFGLPGVPPPHHVRQRAEMPDFIGSKAAPAGDRAPHLVTDHNMAATRRRNWVVGKPDFKLFSYCVYAHRATAQIGHEA